MHSFKLAPLVLAALASCGGGGSMVQAGNPSTPRIAAAPTATPPRLKGITVLPDTTGRFGLIQVGDDWGHDDSRKLLGPFSTSQIKTEAPHEDSIWAAFEPSVWDVHHPGMLVSRYTVPQEDEYLISHHNLTWWQTNHPNWILYACDANGNPTKDLAWSGTTFPNDVPLDIHNPDVVKYEVTQLGKFMAANGYNALAADQMTFENYLRAPNPILGEGKPQPGWYACGIYEHGTFVRRYGAAGSSDLGQPDPAWIGDAINWIATARRIFNTQFTGKHFKIFVNHPILGDKPTAQELQLLHYVDGVAIEDGFTNYGQYVRSGLPSLFTQTLSWMQAAQQNHVATFIIDYYCDYGIAASGAACSYDPSTLTASQVDWALATYAIGNSGGADVYIAPEGLDNFSYRPEYATSYGKPCGTSTHDRSIFMRQFAGGLAIVNASYTAQTVRLPSKHVYTDIEGRTIGNPLTVSGADGYLLLTKGNGCT
ncbi:MAG: hypothetical protein ACRENA_08755 [Vulcanimicrobiaceae bacterium]